jgi:hypothetical protein
MFNRDHGGGMSFGWWFQTAPRLALFAVLLTATGALATGAAADIVGHCRFDSKALAFQGNPQEQASCLLRPVAKFGRVASQSAAVPPGLAVLIGSPTGVLKPALSKYLAANHLDPAKLGGSLGAPVSRAEGGRTDAPAARYFVIHDTSTPWLGNQTAFPPNNAPQLKFVVGRGAAMSWWKRR